MSSKARYEKIFGSDIFKVAPNYIKDDIKDNISWARDVLEKDDKIVWFLRTYKYNLIRSHLGWSDDGKQGLAYPDPENGSRIRVSMSDADLKWLKRFEHEHSETAKELSSEDWRSVVDMNNLKHKLAHFIDLHLNSINKLRWDHQSPYELIEECESLEHEWFEKTGARSVPEYGEKFMVTKDGYTWFNLHRSGCPVEGQSMHHCGNGQGRRGQNIYSLRSRDPDRDGHWIPHVTLIMNDDDKGITGEIKGYGNYKPDEKYWPSLLEFIRTDKVSKMEGGGYKPENNFDISDLSEDVRKELFEEKPSLFGFYTQWLLNDKKINEGVILGLASDLRLSENDIKSQSVQLYSGTDIDELAHYFKLKELSCYKEIIKNGHFQLDEVPVCEYECEEVFDKLIAENNQVIDLLAKYAKENYEEVLDDYDLDMSSGSDIVKLGNILTNDYDDDVIYNAMLYASSDSAENGAYGELYTAIGKMVEDINDVADDSFSKFISEISTDNELNEKETMASNVNSKENKDVSLFFKENHYQEEWYFRMSFQKLLELYHDEIIENGKNYDDTDIIYAVKESYMDIMDFKDLNVPYNGFSESCEESAYEAMVARLEDELHTFKLTLEARSAVSAAITEPFANEAAQQAAQAKFISKHIESDRSLGL